MWRPAQIVVVKETFRDKALKACVNPKFCRIREDLSVTDFVDADISLHLHLPF